MVFFAIFFIRLQFRDARIQRAEAIREAVKAAARFFYAFAYGNHLPLQVGQTLDVLAMSFFQEVERTSIILVEAADVLNFGFQFLDKARQPAIFNFVGSDVITDWLQLLGEWEDFSYRFFSRFRFQFEPFYRLFQVGVGALIDITDLFGKIDAQAFNPVIVFIQAA